MMLRFTKDCLHGCSLRLLLFTSTVLYTFSTLAGEGDFKTLGVYEHTNNNSSFQVYGRKPEKLDILWAPCPAHFDGGTAGECARVTVPLRRDKPTGKNIDIAVKKFTLPNAKGAIWLNEGGPGGTGWTFETAALGLIKAFNDAGWDAYVYTHRGTSVPENGTELTCNASIDGNDVPQDQLAACSQQMSATWGGQEIGFNSYEAADDLAALIMNTRRIHPKQKMAMYGGSYGSYLVERFLQRYPHGVDVAVLDGVLPLGLKNVLISNAMAGEAAIMGYFKKCASIPNCVSRLGPDPQATARIGFRAIADNSCAIDDTNGVIAKSIALLGDPIFPYAIAARASRCNDTDRIALRHLVNFLTDPRGNGGSRPPIPRGFFQSAAGDSIAMADILPLKFDRNVWESALANNIFFPARQDQEQVTTAEYWIQHPETASHRDDRHFQAHIPLLFVHGDLDTQTPLAWLKSTVKWLQPNATVLRIPTGGHVNALGSAQNCGTKNMINFINNPKKTLDFSCVKGISETVDFIGTKPETKALANRYFNSDSVWGE